LEVKYQITHLKAFSAELLGTKQKGKPFLRIAILILGGAKVAVSLKSRMQIQRRNFNFESKIISREIALHASCYACLFSRVATFWVMTFFDACVRRRMLVRQKSVKKSWKKRFDARRELT
jgi:hypothetical protein